MSGEKKRKRKKIDSLPCPNPLFEKWLLEWKEDAASKHLDIQYSYAKALQSLRKFPLKLNAGKECVILKNFGPTLCGKLDKKLAEHLKNYPGTTNSDSCNNVKTGNLSSDKDRGDSLQTNERSPKKKLDKGSSYGFKAKKSTEYIPNWRSGPYALLLTLYQEQQSNYKGCMNKKELQEKAQVLCDASFTKPDPGSRYTAWSSMSIILKKGLVSKTGNPAKFSLTSDGEALVVKLLSGNAPVKSSADKSKNDFSDESDSPLKKKSNLDELVDFFDTNSADYYPRNSEFRSNSQPITSLNQTVSIPTSSFSQPVNCCLSNDYMTKYADIDEQLIFMPGDFRVYLLVDTQETQCRSANSDDTVKELKALNVNFEVRHLKVGDYVWICRDNNGAELMLPYIVERKRMDDLGGSIKDGRFREQKFRLKQCGLENVIYLVEEYGFSHLGLPLGTLQQSIVNTLVFDDFFVKLTSCHKDAMTYLAIFTKLLTKTFSDKTLVSCSKQNLPKMDVKCDLLSLITFTEFSKTSAKNKNVKVKDLFAKQLMQIRGVTIEKARAISNLYPTPNHLIKAYKNCPKGESMLERITFGSLSRNIGPTISKTIFRLYSNLKLK